MNTTLICTVGGSHEPILEAIRSVRPDRVCFVCTDTDSGTGKPGSRHQIDGRGSIIKAKWNDEKPSLPNIPTQAALRDNQWQVTIVSADDLDGCFETIHALLAREIEINPEARLVVDYTGGTKTMTAAAILAGLDFEPVELQLVTGARADLQQVRSGTEIAVSANVERVRLRRAMAPFLDTWKRYAYDEAEAGLRALVPPRDIKLRAIWNRAVNLSAAFSHWDRFDHAAAGRLLDTYQAAVAPHGWQNYFPALQSLNTEGKQREPLHLLDLWRNAERRAAQGRFDDAVARCYRLLEWAAQYLLRRDIGIETGKVSANQLAPGMQSTPDNDGFYRVGLMGAWQLVERHVRGNPGKFFAANSHKMRDLIKRRNHSILAHGDTPVDAAAWQEWKAWIEEPFLPMLLEEASKDKIRHLPPQLPHEFPQWLLHSNKESQA